MRALVAVALAAVARPGPAGAQTNAVAPSVAPVDAELIEKEIDALHARLEAAQEQGNEAEAVPLADRELALRGGDLGPPSNAGINLVQVYLFRGDYARAEQLLLRMLAARGPQSDDDSPISTGRVLLALGEVYRAQNDVAQAEERMKQSRGFFVSDGTGVLRYLVLDALARLYEEQGAAFALDDVLAQMRAAIREMVYQTPQDRALPDLRAAGLSLRRGQIRAAEERLDAARAELEPALSADHPLRAELLQHRGVLLTRKGDPAAEGLLLQALVIRERHFAPYHPAILQTLGHLANLYLQQGRAGDAVRARERASALQDQAAQVALAVGSERRKRLYMDLVQRDTDAVVSLHLRSAQQDQAAARLALRTILRRKGLVLDAIAGSFVALRRSLDVEGQALFDAIAQLDARLSTGMSRGAIDISAEVHQREMRQLEAERQGLEAKLAARAQALPGGDPPQAPVTVERIQAAIPEGAALVEIVVYRPHAPFGPPVTPTWGAPRYAAYVVRRRGDVAGVDLGEAAGIDAVAAKLSLDLANPERDPRMGARHLDSLVMQPIRALLGGARWILLSPDGALNLVPFAALVDEEGRDLVERASFTYLTSGRDLLRAFERAAADTAGREALVIADPAFGSAGGGFAKAPPDDGSPERGLRSGDMAAAQFPSLSGTRGEAEAVQRALGGATLLAGAKATEEALKAVHRPRLLHLATHGFFLPDQTTGDAAADARAAGAPGWSENPLLRSGLALAGANARRSASDQDDGVLTALEISGLDLRGTQLVVLSACETGLGEVRRGDGVYGLRRALVFAGAETQVMSLWKVGDAATSELMASYYAALARGGGRSEALRGAQLQIRRERPHPSAWAGFIVSGDGAALDGRQVAPSFPRAAPSARGCACAAGREGGRDAGALVALGAMLVWAARARLGRRTRRGRRRALWSRRGRIDPRRQPTFIMKGR